MKLRAIVAALLLAGCGSSENQQKGHPTIFDVDPGLPDSLEPTKPHKHLGSAMHSATGLLIRSLLKPDSEIYFTDRSSPDAGEYTYEIAFELAPDPDRIGNHLSGYFSPWREQEPPREARLDRIEMMGAHKFDPASTRVFMMNPPGDRSAKVWVDAVHHTFYFRYNAL